MSSPKLIIRRVVVEGDLSFDQRFYPGLNIIHAVQTGQDTKSTNGCGKTSLVELIQHGFGKSHQSKAKFHFGSIMDQLKTLWLEFETDNGVYTIGRSLSEIFGVARLYDGPYVVGMEKTPAETVKIDDMSQLLLKLTGIPEVSVNKLSGEPDPLSFRLLMRAFILHQEDSFAEILFKVEPETRRTDIIGFLTGITPIDRYSIEMKVGELIQQKELSENYIDQVSRFLLENNTPSPIEANARVSNAVRKLELARQEQQTIQKFIIEQESSDKLGHTDLLRRSLLDLKQEIAELEQNIFNTQLEETRIKELIASLRNDKRKSLHLQSSSTKLSSVEFEICPRCLQDITTEMQQRESSGRCSLCNRSLIVISDAIPKRILSSDDVDLQIEESEEILKSLQKEIEHFKDHSAQLNEKSATISRELEAQVLVYVSPAVDQLIAQANTISECQSELTKAVYIQEQASSLEKLRADLNKLKSELAELQDKLAEAKKSRQHRREIFRQIYSTVMKEVDFPKLQEITLNPQTFMPNINGEPYMRQGTALRGLATVCYHLALLSLARNEQTYFPKMLIIDSPNVGDLNEDNHTKLLNYFAKLYSDTSDTEQDWQIILTTRYLPSSLEPFVRETISNPERMLLRKP